MFESAELGHKIEKPKFEREAPKLREALLLVQHDLHEAARFPVLVIIGGVEGAGKGETVHLLNQWMDPRHIHTHGFLLPGEEAAERPPTYRFWKALPPKGDIGIFFGSWYTLPILARAFKKSGENALDRAIAEIRHLERMLHNEGVLIVKFWLHLSKKQQAKRLRELEKSKSTRWRVTKADWQLAKRYDRLRDVSEKMLRETSTAEAPWVVVDGSDHCFRSLTIGKVLLEAMRRRLDESRNDKTVTAAPIVPQVDNLKLLRDLDLGQKLNKKEYGAEIEKYQGRFNRLVRDKDFQKRSLVLAFEGWDAAGKGGAIRRVCGALDARFYKIVPVAAPTEEERAQPYLWRFWRHAPGHRDIVLFDRTWYGRVLVERVEKFCSEADWMRAYDEINEFEEQLVNNGAILCKFWLHLSKDEQMRRFKEREKTAFKRFKITEEDWRNRKKWDAYEQAVCDMIDRTSTEPAPWTVIEAEDKFFARVKVLKTICRALKDGL